MMTLAIYQALLGVGMLTAAVVPLAVLTWHWWEPVLHRWLDHRRRRRETSSLRKGLRAGVR